MSRRGDGTWVISNGGSRWGRAQRRDDSSWLISRKRAPSPYDALIERLSDQHGVDHGLVKSVMLVESGFNPRARSHKGAMGLMQLMPDTARRFGVHNAWSPEENIRGGVRYLRYLLDLFRGNVELALAGYNAGENAVLRYGRIPPYDETRDYVRKVMTAFQESPRLASLSPGSVIRSDVGRVQAWRERGSDRVVISDETTSSDGDEVGRLGRSGG